MADPAGEQLDREIWTRRLRLGWTATASSARSRRCSSTSRARRAIEVAFGIGVSPSRAVGANVGAGQRPEYIVIGEAP